MKKIVFPIAALLSVASLSGCAKDPSNIDATAVPAGTYAGKSCAQLAADHESVMALLIPLEKKQKQAATGDAVGVFLIGVPVSSLGGADNEPQIAAYKGQVQGIEAEMKRKGC